MKIEKIDSIVKPSRFIKLPDGWIRDLENKLDWAPSSSKPMSFAKAEQYAKDQCGRLPTRFNLESIIDIAKYNPAIDTEIFNDTRSECYWTSDKYVGLNNCRWVVGFYCGYVYFGFEDSNIYVRPVRPSQC